MKTLSNWLEQPAAAAAAKSLQLCLTLCDPIDSNPQGSLVPRILQARTLDWVAISFSNIRQWKVRVKSLVVSDSSRPHGRQPTRLLHPWDFPGKSNGVRCHCLLQEQPMLYLNKYLNRLVWKEYPVWNYTWMPSHCLVIIFLNWKENICLSCNIIFPW